MVVLNFIEETKDIKTISRYNGGWLKTVTGLDKTKTTGYSIIGEFVKAGNYKHNYTPGLYLDCSKYGSSDKQVWNYHLFIVSDDGFQLIKTLPDAGRDWATKLWDTIEENLNKTNKITAESIVKEILEKTEDTQIIQEIIDLLKTRQKHHYFKEHDLTLDEIKTYLKLNHIYEFTAIIPEDTKEDAIEKLAKIQNTSPDRLRKSEDTYSVQMACIFEHMRIPFNLKRVQYLDFNSNIDRFQFGFYVFFKDRIEVYAKEYNELNYAEIPL